MRKAIWWWGKVGLSTAIFACTSAEEPGLPTSPRPKDGRIVRVPVQADGTLDTAGMAQLRFDESRYAFGRVDEGAIVEHRFAFRNTGASPLTITNASSSCGCTIPRWPREPVGAGDTASIYVRFDTEGKAGPQTKTVTLTANAFPNKTEVALTGVVDAQ